MTSRRDPLFPNLDRGLAGRDPSQDRSFNSAESDQVIEELLVLQQLFVDVLGVTSPDYAGTIQGGPDSGDGLLIRSNPTLDGTVTVGQDLHVGDGSGEAKIAAATGNSDIVISYPTAGTFIVQSDDSVDRLAVDEEGVIFIRDTDTIPVSNPVDGAYLYSSGGRLSVRQENGTVILIAAGGGGGGGGATAWADITDTTATLTEINYVDGVTSAIQTQLDGKAASSHTHLTADLSDTTVTAAELNFLAGVTSDVQTQFDNHTHTVSDITDLTATATELNYTDGVTSAIQTQLDGKSATGHTHVVANITDLTATVTELNYTDGVTSAIQTQLDGKSATGHTHTLSDVTDITATAAEVNYTTDVTSNIQAQIDLKSPLASPTFTGIVTLPTDAAPGVTSNGEIAVDTSVTDMAYGLLRFYASEPQFAISVPTTELSGITDGQGVFYNATSDKFEIGDVIAGSHTHTLSDISDITATATEVNYTTDVTGLIQAQLDGKSGTSHTHTLSDVSDITATAAEVNYTTDVTSNIQAQIDLKAPLASPTFTGIVTLPTATTPGVSGNGDIAVDTTETGFSHGLIRFFAGEDQFVMSMPVGNTSSISDGHVISYNATNDELEFVSPLGGGHTHTVSEISDLTATATELNYTDGVTSAIQTQLDGKALGVHTHTLSDVTDVTATATEVNYTTDVTGLIQAQLDGKSSTSHTHNLADVTDITATAAEVNYTTDVTSNIQAQIDLKAPLASPTFTGIVTLPSAAAPTVDTEGDISVDSDITLFSHGLIRFFGTEEQYIVSVPIGTLDSISSGQVLAYNATNDEFDAVDANTHTHTVSQLSDTTVTATELDYVSGVTSGIQAQLNGKLSAVTSPITLTSSTAGEIPITVVAHASQSGNMTEWEDSSNVVGARITSAQEFSNPQSTTLGEAFGDGASTSNSSVALGAQASTSAASSVAIGYGADAASATSVVIGAEASISASHAIAIGYQASAVSDAIAIGYQTTAANTKSTIIGFGATGNFSLGYGASSSHVSGLAIGTDAEADTDRTIALGTNAAASGFSGVVAIGRDAVADGNNQLVIGTNVAAGNGRIEDVYIGRGQTSTTTSPVTYHGGGGSGTDIAGGNIILAGGKGTGTGAGGEVVFSTSDAGSTGTTLQTLTEKARVLVSGGLQLAQSSADPSTPATGFGRIWISDGTGSGSDGNVMAINESGTVTNLSNATVASPLTLTSGAAAEIPITVVAHASQSGNMTEWEDSSNVVGARITSAQEFSNTSTFTSAELFGAGVTGSDYSTVIGTGAVGSGEYNVAIGPAATSTGTLSTAIGYASDTNTHTRATVIGSNSEAVGNDAVAIGHNASADTSSVAIGRSTIADQSFSVVICPSATGGFSIGYQADSSAVYSMALGRTASATHAYSIALGRDATSTANSQFIVGSDISPITSVYAGNGVVAATPTDVTYNATGGSGTDIAGGNIILAGGKGTGTGAGGAIVFKTSDVGSTGTTLQTLTEKAKIDNAGVITAKGYSNTTATNSEAFGDGATATSGSTAMGKTATGGSNEGVAVGYLSDVGIHSVGIGKSADATATYAVAIGHGTVAGASGLGVGRSASSTGNGIALGQQAVAIGNSVAIGDRAEANHSGSFVFGTTGVSTAGAQFVAGANTVPMTNVFFGKGVIHATPTDYTVNGTGGDGTDIAGANIILAGGKGTGTGAGGAIVFKMSDVGSTGTTLQTLTEKAKIDNAGVITAKGYSNTVGDSTSEAFGSGATATSTNTVAFGALATASNFHATAFGYDAVASGSLSSAFGSSALASGTFSTAIGVGAETTAAGVAVGYGAETTAGVSVGYNSESANNSFALGGLTTASHAGSIGIGAGAATTASNQVVIGSGSVPMRTVFIGKGETHAAPESITYNATGGDGTDIAGANIILAGGKGTGSGAGGEVVFSTSDAGSTGTTLQTLTEKARVLVSGGLQLAQSSADPSTPATGFGRLWISDGTGSGSDGDVMSINESGTVVNLSSSGGGAASPLTLTSSGASEIPLTLVADGSQSGNRFQTETSGGTVGARITAGGDFSNNEDHADGEAFGDGATSASKSVALGKNAANGAIDSVAIGHTATASHASAIVIGRNAVSTAADQLVIGADGLGIASVYIGEGVTATAPSGITYHGSGGSGTNVAAGDFNIAAGKATGNAVGGDIAFKTSDAGASGTTLQTLTEKMRILASGNVGINDSAPTAKLHITVDDTEATECLEMQQDDDSEAFMEFVSDVDSGSGEEEATDYPISDFTTNMAMEGSIQGMVRIKINGTTYWMPYYDDPM